MYLYTTGSLEIPPTTGLPFFLESMLEVDASLNADKLTETKNGNTKIKNQLYERRHSQ